MFLEFFCVFSGFSSQPPNQGIKKLFNDNTSTQPLLNNPSITNFSKATTIASSQPHLHSVLLSVTSELNKLSGGKGIESKPSALTGLSSATLLAMAGTVTGIGLNPTPGGLQAAQMSSMGGYDTRKNSILNNPSARSAVSINEKHEKQSGGFGNYLKTGAHSVKFQDENEGIEQSVNNVSKVGKGVLKNNESSKVVNSELLQAVESPLAMEAKVSDWIFNCNTIENKLNPSESMSSIHKLSLAVITINDEGGDVEIVGNEVEGSGRKSRSPRSKSPMSKSPRGKSPRSKSPISKSPMDKSPMDKSPRDKSPRDKNYADKSSKVKSSKDKIPKVVEKDTSSGILKSNTKTDFKSDFKYIENNELTVEHDLPQHSTGKKRSKERSRSKSKSRSQKSDDKPLTVKLKKRKSDDSNKPNSKFQLKIDEKTEDKSDTKIEGKTVEDKKSVDNFNQPSKIKLDTPKSVQEITALPKSTEHKSAHNKSAPLKLAKHTTHVKKQHHHSSSKRETKHTHESSLEIKPETTTVRV